MRDPQASRAPFINQIVLLAMTVLILYLVVDFGRQVVRSRQRHDDLRLVDERIATILEDEERLQQHLEWAMSPEAAEAYAREHGWAKEGEVPVVIVPGAATPVPIAEPPPLAELPAGSPRDAWLDLFFGER